MSEGWWPPRARLSLYRGGQSQEVVMRIARSQTRAFRLMELLGLFVLLPTLLFFQPELPLMPVLWFVAGGCGYLLARDPEFDQANFWRASALTKGARTFALHFF